MGQRIKGQEVQVLLIAGGVPVETLTAVKSFEVAFQIDTLTEGYLGETTDRRDAIFKGISGKMELHMEDQTILILARAIIDKARRRTPNVQFNIKATLNFPNGERPLVIIYDVAFGEIPLNFGSRSDYGSTSLTFQAAEAQVLTT